MLGAEVVKIESISHPDPARFGSVRSPDEDLWWEAAPIFHGANTNKRDLTLNLNDERGRDIAKRLIAVSDVVMENFSPRVMEHFALTYDTVRAINPNAVMVRMPAFGLDGPWRDRIGYAQTMEQVTGMAWTTGYADGPPLIPRGLCDPLTGLHAVIGMLLGLAHRERTGEGQLVEQTMVEAALNIAAEPFVEFSKYGALLERQGNHGAHAVPQNVYACERVDTWVAIAVESDAQWSALVTALDRPSWALDPGLATAAGRRRAEDRIDKELGEWCRTRTPQQVVDALWPSGVPVADVVAPGDVSANPQLQARGFFETLSHPVIGTHDAFPSLPFRLSEGPPSWNRVGAPTLGRDNEAILRWVFGLSDAQIHDLREERIVGERPLGL
jgi:crotonobetainyl-CoA:carnitine CoA-transferase CaiB-like acyl-CoA transferase